MAATQTTAQAIDFGTDELGRFVENYLATGMTLGEIRGLGRQDFEAIYGVGYNLYNQGKYDDAENVFKFLCFYDHLEKRTGWASAPAGRCARTSTARSKPIPTWRCWTSPIPIRRCTPGTVISR
ncbi:MAG: tetratricopeptide repeat protein [Gammaproteobacteria bacterium]